jgi:hypothetical protein
MGNAVDYLNKQRDKVTPAQHKKNISEFGINDVGTLVPTNNPKYRKRLKRELNSKKKSAKKDNRIKGSYHR